MHVSVSLNVEWNGQRTKQPYCATTDKKNYNTRFGINHIILRIDAIKACVLALLLTSVHPGVSYISTTIRMQLLNFN